jgi:hypothetical protein
VVAAWRRLLNDADDVVAVIVTPLPVGRTRAITPAVADRLINVGEVLVRVIGCFAGNDRPVDVTLLDGIGAVTGVFGGGGDGNGVIGDDVGVGVGVLVGIGATTAVTCSADVASVVVVISMDDSEDASLMVSSWPLAPLRRRPPRRRFALLWTSAGNTWASLSLPVGLLGVVVGGLVVSWWLLPLWRWLWWSGDARRVRFDDLVNVAVAAASAAFSAKNCSHNNSPRLGVLVLICNKPDFNPSYFINCHICNVNDLRSKLMNKWRGTSIMRSSANSGRDSELSNAGGRGWRTTSTSTVVGAERNNDRGSCWAELHTPDMWHVLPTPLIVLAPAAVVWVATMTPLLPCVDVDVCDCRDDCCGDDGRDVVVHWSRAVTLFFNVYITLSCINTM